MKTTIRNEFEDGRITVIQEMTFSHVGHSDKKDDVHIPFEIHFSGSPADWRFINRTLFEAGRLLTKTGWPESTVE